MISRICRRLLGRSPRSALVLVALLAVVTLLWTGMFSDQNSRIRTRRTSDASVEDASASAHASSSAFPPDRSRQRYVVVVDGLIFQLQGGQPKGISVVWKNLMPELAKNFGGPASNESRLVFIDRTPGHGISQHIARQPFVEHLKLEGDLSLEDAISKKVMAGYAFDDAARLPERDEDTAVNRNRPIVVFMSTYYNWPKIDGMCNVLMYHDLIPERVGMYAGPGSEYWPRIDILRTVNSIVSVSHSTSRDILDLYGDRVRKQPGDAYYEDGAARRSTSSNSMDTSYLYNTIISTTPNRISRTMFPGPMSAARMLAFRSKYHIWDSPEPMFRTTEKDAATGEPIVVAHDFLTTVGSSHSYKNFPTLFSALDLLPDAYLRRISVLMVGRDSPNDDERSRIKRHPLIVRYADGNELFYNASAVSPSDVPVRVQILSFIDDADMPVLYSNALGLVYISSYEGFGLPLAEAMTSGTLGIVTNSSSLPEVGGPPSITTYVQRPTSASDVAKGIEENLGFLESERRERVRQARKWVERYGGGGKDGQPHGWDEMARLIAEHIRGNRHRGADCYRSGWAATQRVSASTPESA